MITGAALTDHPAKFSDTVLAQLRAIVEDEAVRLGRRPNVLDPFAGVGRIHDLNDIADTTGVELEPEWAACRSGTIVGDATDLPASWTNYYDLITTSPCYGNRFADNHNPQDTHKACKGAGCTGCKGTGISPRKGYKFSLGRDPSEGSGAVLQWGDRYKNLHRAALTEMIRCVDDGGLVVVNMSNHVRGVKVGQVTRSQLMRVVEWWIEVMLAQGLYMEAVFPVRTKRMRHGAGYNLRAGVEHIIVMRKPWPLEEATP